MEFPSFVGQKSLLILYHEISDGAVTLFVVFHTPSFQFGRCFFLTFTVKNLKHTQKFKKKII